MTSRQHHYSVDLEWTGNRGEGTTHYTAYERDFEARVSGKPSLEGSADPAFRGNGARWNPEDLLVASVSACHKLWYLHLCADAGIRVMTYLDHAEGTMREGTSGGKGDPAAESGRFTAIVLRPEITLAAGDNIALALELHHRAHALCFIANSLNFPVSCEAVITHQ
ncbi:MULTISPECIES: OsmC family protein [Cobetia]|uniref:OsmC family protein n=1 Tax=Cobetia TaxID=204286 RepID=UPI0009861290|nr:MULTISPECIES: OsmC family protein [Cobetia]POR06293.1 peroxiredoxin [Cobetia sp. MM1IDA2H-1]